MFRKHSIAAAAALRNCFL